MMGRDGMKKATQVAILSANYIASTPVGCITRFCTPAVTVASLMNASSTSDRSRNPAASSEEDVAKRLIDYGFHSPTMSFPVPGTLMIEPTESESLAEIDRFCEAMLSIREEIRAVEQGTAGCAGQRTEKRAPYVRPTSGDWNHGYSREQAAYPVQGLYLNKFWAPVSRVDNVYGDRNLICSCPPLEAWVVDPDEE